MSTDKTYCLTTLAYWVHAIVWLLTSCNQRWALLWL